MFQVEKLSPQLIAAGKIRLLHPDSKVAEEHFNNLKQQYGEAVLRVRDLCDQAVQPRDFVRTAGNQLQPPGPAGTIWRGYVLWIELTRHASSWPRIEQPQFASSRGYL